MIDKGFLEILKAVAAESVFYKDEFVDNYEAVIKTYNRMRKVTITNNYYTKKMFHIFIKIQNYKSIVVLIAEHLDDL